MASSVLLDAEKRLAVPGKERVLLWTTSLKTAIYDDGEAYAGRSRRVSARIS